MAFNGSGTFNRTNGDNTGSTTWVSDKNDGDKIVASRHDTHDQDLANGLSNCICKDGQTTITANLPMATYRHTGVGNAVNRTDYASAADVQDNTLQWGGTSGGSSNAYTLTLSPTIAAYVDGQTYWFQANHSSTGAATINIDSVGAKDIKLPGGGAVATDDIVSGQEYGVIYDDGADDFFLVNPSASIQANNITETSSGVGVVIDGVTLKDGGATFSAGLTYSANPWSIVASTSDASDTSEINMSGGGAYDVSRGALLALSGNEDTNTGQVRLYAGNVTGGEVQMYSGASLERWSVDENGDLIPGANNSYDIGSSSVSAAEIHATKLLKNGADLTVGTVGAYSLDLQSNGSVRWNVSSSGHLQPETDATYTLGASAARPATLFGNKLDLDFSANTYTSVIYAIADHATYAADVAQLSCARAATTSYNFLTCYSATSADLEFKLNGAGTGTCDGSWTGGGADYAEYFESADGSPLPYGMAVVLDGEKVRLFDASSDDASDIIGVTRPANGGPSVIGNLPLKWQKKYQRDVYGAYILNEAGERQLNPDYDPEKEYISREDREEWNVIGMLGQIPVSNSSGIHPSWKLMKVLDDNNKLYLVK